jgi:RNA polymerase sigma-70 factor (ECF subfamily)
MPLAPGRPGRSSGDQDLSQQVKAEMVSLLPRLRRFAYGLTGSLDEGDDLTQAACEKALRSLAQFTPGTRLDSWMYRIAQNLWIDRRRSQQVQREQSVEPADLEGLAIGDAAREMDRRLDLADVRREVALLPEDQRAVLLLVSVEGCGYRQAAEILEIPIGTVMSRLARARLALGKALTGTRKELPETARTKP